jgi:hypothetical protein
MGQRHASLRLTFAVTGRPGGGHTAPAVRDGVVEAVQETSGERCGTPETAHGLTPRMGDERQRVLEHRNRFQLGPCDQVVDDIDDLRIRDVHHVS